MKRPPAVWVVAVGILVLAACHGAKTHATVQRDKPIHLVTFDLATLPRGVSTRDLRGTRVFVVGRGSNVDVMLTDVHHMGQRELWWCQMDHRFTGPRYAEQFDVAGQVLGGPASSGLDRFSTEVRHGVVIVNLDHRLPGPPRGTHAPLPASWTPRWSQDDGLCSHPLKAGV